MMNILLTIDLAIGIAMAQYSYPYIPTRIALPGCCMTEKICCQNGFCGDPTCNETSPACCAPELICCEDGHCGYPPCNDPPAYLDSEYERIVEACRTPGGPHPLSAGVLKLTWQNPWDWNIIWIATLDSDGEMLIQHREWDDAGKCSYRTDASWKDVLSPSELTMLLKAVQELAPLDMLAPTPEEYRHIPWHDTARLTIEGWNVRIETTSFAMDALPQGFRDVAVPFAKRMGEMCWAFDVCVEYSWPFDVSKGD